MNAKQIELFWRIIEAFDREKVLEHIMFVGSWAEFLYEESEYLSGFKASSKTFDLDLLIKNQYKQFNPPHNLCELIKGLGFELNLHREGYMKFEYFEEGTALYIEFLVSSERPVQIPKKLTHYGVNAEVLPMDLLQKHSIELKVQGFKILAPSPAAYVLHKMIINKERAQDKQEKDQLAIDNIFNIIKMDQFQVREFQLIYEQLGKKQRKLVDEYKTEHFLFL